MTISLHTLQGAPRRKGRRIGRGHGSGRGTYAGRGLKGQRARSGGRSGLRRRSLMRLLMHLPKVRGFRSLAPPLAAVSLDRIVSHFPDGAHVTVDTLRAAGFLHRRAARIKILLGKRKLEKKLTVTADAFSKGAEQALKDAGGLAIRIEPRKTTKK